ncbi:MYB DNA-binding domain containing protein [Coccidioides immitis RMSCC 3703]|uniref:MYB DNA-binding domain containing protein n=1 Tax=Coccidioides immitis RMSCC 3703 TaxID=454286 RepID=A0A0J8R6M1_COCIT|nr:MYB DNA-binding domain containing protein [Coccidioides immitis RMSCC 3703]
MVLRIIPRFTADTLDISLLLGSHDEEKEATSTTTTAGGATASPRPPDSELGTLPRPSVSTASPEIPGALLASRPGSSAKRPLQDASPRGRPAKKQSKWSPEENALILELRGGGMKCDDISKRIPGRSPISSRLHYQYYLERRCEWDEDRKNRLADFYDRIAEEMAIPWRAAEAMPWQLGEAEMAQRAGVTPFSFSAPPTQSSPRARRNTLSRRDRLSTSQLPSLAELTAGIPAYTSQMVGEPHPAMASSLFHPEPGPTQIRRGSRPRAHRR